jgi:hypothetical protein
VLPIDDVLTSEVGAAPGFGLLYGPTDPRFDALLRQAGQRGRADLPFADLCQRAARLARRRGIEPHAFVAVCALFLDLDLAPEHVGLIATLSLFHLGIAHAAESALRPEPALQKVAPELVRYVGRPPRTSPRARNAP